MKKIILVCVLSMMCTGCAATKIATKDDLYRLNSNTSEEIIDIKDRMLSLENTLDDLKYQSEANRKELGKLHAMLKQQRSENSKQLQKVQGEIASQKVSFDKKTDLILDTVNEEYKRLVAKVHSLEKPNSEEYETGSYHTVQKGESLSKIASKYGVSVERVMSSNEISDPNKIRVNQKIFIPERGY